MKNKIVAAILAWFFGWAGIHRFYLGQYGAGVLYLLFCWTFIPAIIAFFEFFLLIFMSDEAFNAQYNAQYLTSNQVLSANRGIHESSKDKIAVLSELKKLYESGVITAEEYEQKRRKFLDSL